jgi:hypothetical protein
MFNSSGTFMVATKWGISSMMPLIVPINEAVSKPLDAIHEFLYQLIQ